MVAAAAQRPRVAAEACLEALTAELVRHYRMVGQGAVPPAIIETIGKPNASIYLPTYVFQRTLCNLDAVAPYIGMHG